jgi:microcystin-dependent protein
MANYIKSTNFTAKDTLPSGDAARIVKGTEIDVEFNAIASAVASKSDSNSPSFTGTPTAPTAVAGTNTTQIATTAFADAAAKAAFPVGGIILWSGSIANIPATWQLCDGTNGTPNLRDRFIVGAGSTYAVNATGGANTVTLDATMIPSHTHSISASGSSGNASTDHVHALTASGTTSGHSNDHAHSGTTSAVSNDHSHNFSGTTSGQSNTHSHAVSDPGHAHSTTSWQGGAAAGQGGGGDAGQRLSSNVAVTSNTATTGISIGNANADHSHTYSGTTSGISANHTHTVTTGGVSANHTHTVTVTGTSGGQSVTHNHSISVSATAANTGGGLAHENRPPYFALCYIQKMS